MWSDFNTKLLPVVSVNLTPSRTCRSDGSGKKDFLELMSTLDLECTRKLADLISAVEPVGTPCSFNPFTFQWGTRPESQGYVPLKEYLEASGFQRVYVIANGEGLNDKLLFNEVDVFTLRPCSGQPANIWKKHERVPIKRFSISGRSDVVVVDEKCLHRYYGREHVLFVLEVKTIDGFSDDSLCLREAALQLIGLNVANIYVSPPVVLTNLNGKHYVLYIDRGADHETCLKFTMKIHKFTLLAEALHYVREYLIPRSCVTKDFGRGLTPDTSVKSNLPSIAEDDDDEDDLHFPSVQAVDIEESD